MDKLRTSIDIPRDLHRRLHETARLRGCLARRLILESIERIVLGAAQQRPRRRLSLERAPVLSRRHLFDLSANFRFMTSLRFPDINVWLALLIEDHRIDQQP